MPPALRLKPEDVDTPEKRAQCTIAIVGGGMKAAFYALAFGGVGFKVVCGDADQSIVKKLAKGNFYLNDRKAESALRSFIRNEKVTATSDVKAAASKSDVVIVAVNAKVDAKKGADYSEVINACKQIAAGLRKTCLVVYAGAAGLGTAETVLKSTIENTSGLKAGEDFGFAYQSLLGSSVAQVLSGGVAFTIAADDKFSLNAASLIFQAITKKPINRASSIKAAELASLFAAARRDANSALANELAAFCETAGLDYSESSKLLDGYDCQVNPNPTISEEVNRDAAYLLLENAENLNLKLRLPFLARQINEDMVRHATNLTHEVLRDSGKTLRRAKVALLGHVEAGTAAAQYMELLLSKGTRISRYDPNLHTEEQNGESNLKKTLNETVEGTDCVVVFSEQEQLKRLNLKKLHALMKTPAALLDLVGAVEPEKAEKEGFVYRRLGRGAWKK